MRFYYGKQDLCSLSRAEENLILLTNGLGGYVSVTSAANNLSASNSPVILVI